MLAVKKNVFRAVLRLSKEGELRTEHGNRFHAAGPATTKCTSAELCPRPLKPQPELQGRREQTTEFDLQHRNLRKARINMQRPVHALLCTSSDTV